MPILLAATYFTAVVMDTGARLLVVAGTPVRTARRIFGVPDFRLYALSDGLRRLFTRHAGDLRPVTVQTDEQLYFEKFTP